ncbi:MAG TPA: PAS domain-containing sensor histidine kinase, partial [Chroococcales cyanobacterium]
TLIAAESIANSVSVAIRQKQEKEQLLQNEDLLRSLAENVNAAFVINHADQAGALYVNSSVEEIYGVSKEQILKNRFSFFRLVHKDDRQALRHFMLDATPEEQAAGLEFRVVHRDGSLHWIWGRLFPKIGSKDHVVYGISQDVTARKETEQRVKEFYSIISHELRTPLTSIHASFRLMESGLAGPLPPKAARVSEIGRKETDRLVRLVNNLLDVHKLEEGMLRVTLAPVKAQNLVELSLAAMKGMAQDAGVSINSIVDWNGTIMCDQDRMIQVLTNLLSNAIKHSDSQGDITLKVATKGQSLRFEVIDHGPGIAKELLPLLFHKFLQVETSDARGKRGSGLGLVVAKAIVEQHGGKVGVDSDLGRGSTFWVELPMRSESKSQGQESSPASAELVGSM